MEKKIYGNFRFWQNCPFSGMEKRIFWAGWQVVQNGKKSPKRTRNMVYC